MMIGALLSVLMAGVTYRHQKPGQASYSAGQISSEPLTWTAPNAVTVGAASGALVAAGASADVGRVVQIYVPVAAVAGIHVNLAGGAATTNMMLIEPGQTREYGALAAINAIRAGASDVTVYITVGTVT